MSPTAQSNHHQRAKKAVKDFIKQDFNHEHEIKQQCGQMEVGTNGIDWNRVRKGGLLYISSKLDGVEWWREVGQMKHPLIYPTAHMAITTFFKRPLGTHVQLIHLVRLQSISVIETQTVWDGCPSVHE